jgi:hypothetical protein
MYFLLMINDKCWFFVLYFLYAEHFDKYDLSCSQHSSLNNKIKQDSRSPSLSDTSLKQDIHNA